MIPNPQFVNLPKHFWANIRTISQEVGYTVRPKRQKGVKGQAGPIRVPTVSEVRTALETINLSARHLMDDRGHPTDLGKKVLAYFEYRAKLLHTAVEPLLMNAEQAKSLFDEMQVRLGVQRAVPMNKQGEGRKQPAYFTGIINMLIESNVEKLPCNYDPQELTTVTLNEAPLRTLARRIDGAFPGPVNPMAVWEIKEYYHTTTFGSRVADGVYETLLDGMELAELRKEEKIDVKHYLMVDAHYTWWMKGRSYLCRIIDMLHMGYVDEVLFGREVVERIPLIVKEWVKASRPTNDVTQA